MSSRQTLAIPARDDANEFGSFDRGMRFLAALEEMGLTVQGRRVADLGTGFGSIAIAAARSGAERVLAFDSDADRLRVVAERARAADVELETVPMNLLSPSRDLPHVDLALLIGVVEYAGLWDSRSSVVALQRRIFETAHRMLEPGGLLVFASKNRLWPPFVLRDVHTGRPLVNALPRRSADALARLLGKEGYRHYIHSPRGWAGLLHEAGFRSVETYYPYFSYQFPLLIVRRPSVEAIRAIRSRPATEEEAYAALGRLWRLKAALMALGAMLGVPLSHAVIMKAEK